MFFDLILVVKSGNRSWTLFSKIHCECSVSNCRYYYYCFINVKYSFMVFSFFRYFVSFTLLNMKQTVDGFTKYCTNLPNVKEDENLRKKQKPWILQSALICLETFYLYIDIILLRCFYPLLLLFLSILNNWFTLS